VLHIMQTSFRAEDFCFRREQRSSSRISTRLKPGMTLLARTCSNLTEVEGLKELSTVTAYVTSWYDVVCLMNQKG
jgi:hypothetical protein